MTDQTEHMPDGSDQTPMPAPVFLMSAPRSGSTLLQRLLMQHPRIHSAAETWLIPASFLTGSETGVLAAASARWSRRGLADTCAALPGGKASWHRAIGIGLEQCFADLCPPGTEIFLEKTPRNALFLDAMADAFPTARYIFLWRNPLAIKASMNRTWSGGGWNFRCPIDLHEGLAARVEHRVRLGERAIDIRYEDLIAAPQAQIDRLTAFLDLAPLDVEAVQSAAAQSLRDGLGDQAGVARHGTEIAGTDSAWRTGFANPVRQAWARHYLDWIGDTRLSAMGYDRAELIDGLGDSHQALGRMPSDLARMAYARLNEWLLLDAILQPRRRGGVPHRPLD